MTAAAQPDPDRSPIFVVGTGRSGTTLLRMMLNAHPRIYLTHEASFYLSTAGLPKNPPASQWLERYFYTLPFAWLRLSRAELRDRLCGQADKSDLSVAFAAVMRCKAAKYRKPRYGDKTPLHSAFLRQIFEDYPDPRVVHMVRDPRGTVASLLRMPWGSGSVGLNAVYCDRQMKQVKPFADRIHEIRLEDLLREPEKIMRGLLEFVGEQWDEAVLDHEHHAPLDDMPPVPWFANARRNPRAGEGEPAWRRQLSPAWIRMVERTNRYGMERYGYLPAQLGREPGFFVRLGARLGDIREALRSVRRMAQFIRMNRKKELPDPRVGMQALLNINPKAWKYYPEFVLPEVPRVT